MNWTKNFARIILLIVVAAIAVTFVGCTTPKHVAERRIVRKWNGISELLNQYPDLAKLIIKNRPDSVTFGGWSDSTALILPQDTAAFDSLLTEYVRLMRMYEQMQTDTTVTVSGPPLTGSMPTQRPTPAMAMEQMLANMRRELRRGSYRDTTFTYNHENFTATIDFRGGKFAAKFDAKPVTLPAPCPELNVRPADPPSVWQQMRNLWWLPIVCFIAGILFTVAFLRNL